jgi:hypothetical protein
LIKNLQALVPKDYASLRLPTWCSPHVGQSRLWYISSPIKPCICQDGPTMRTSHTLFLRSLGLENAPPIIRLKVLRGVISRSVGALYQQFTLAVLLEGGPKIHLPYDLAGASDRSKGPKARSLIEYKAHFFTEVICAAVVPQASVRCPDASHWSVAE